MGGGYNKWFDERKQFSLPNVFHSALRGLIDFEHSRGGLLQRSAYKRKGRLSNLSNTRKFSIVN